MAVLAVGLVAGLVLVLTGGGDGDATTDTPPDPPPAADDEASGSGADGADGDRSAGDGVEPLDLEDTSQASITELTGLVVPDDARDFLTARLDDGTQLDITFLMPAEAEQSFVEDSGLPEPVPGERPILHSSPLWQLNPESGEIRGTTDRRDGVTRTVELVEEGEGTVRARIVINRAPTA